MKGCVAKNVKGIKRGRGVERAFGVVNGQ